MENCKPIVGKPLQRRVTISFTIDRRILADFKAWMAKTGRTNMSDTIEGFIECGIRDTCEGCPYAEEEKQEKIGIGKIA
jgi:hypothetical protein